MSSRSTRAMVSIRFAHLSLRKYVNIKWHDCSDSLTLLVLKESSYLSSKNIYNSFSEYFSVPFTHSGGMSSDMDPLLCQTNCLKQKEASDNGIYYIQHLPFTSTYCKSMNLKTALVYIFRHGRRTDQATLWRDNLFVRL